MNNTFEMLAILVLPFVTLIGGSSSASAQGRGGGHGQGGGPGMGQSSGAGVGRGVSGSSGRSAGRSHAGLDSARLQRENAQQADEELNDHPQMAALLHTTANDLRSGYQKALLSNPRLTFGQYAAATRLGTNLAATHPNITRDAILAGLANGKSIGQTLQDLGLGKHEASDTKKEAEREIKEAKKR